jgi:hypothetical protein
MVPVISSWNHFGDSLLFKTFVMILAYLKLNKLSWVLVVHACNPSYLGG